MATSDSQSVKTISTFNIITIFPDLISGLLQWGVVGQAVKHKILSVNIVNPRDFTDDLHRSVDDRPYGGGDGMVFIAEPLKRAVESLGAGAGRRIFLSAHGPKWSDASARARAKALIESGEPLTFICGRYGGVDQRFLNEFVDEEISIGDYILSGGELAAAVVIDSLARFLPGVLGNEESKDSDSFSQGLLEAPLFTRPQEFSGQMVPAALISGDHKKIASFRQALALAITRERRPELLTLEQNQKDWPTAKKYLRQISDVELKACGLGSQILQEIYQ